MGDAGLSPTLAMMFYYIGPWCCTRIMVFNVRWSNLQRGVTVQNMIAFLLLAAVFSWTLWQQTGGPYEHIIEGLEGMMDRQTDDHRLEIPLSHLHRLKENKEEKQKKWRKFY